MTTSAPLSWTSWKLSWTGQMLPPAWNTFGTFGPMRGGLMDPRNYGQNQGFLGCQGHGCSGCTACVKNANPSTPLVYPNQRFHKNTTPDANTYCGCGSAVTYFSAMSNKGTCSTPTPKCTSDSFFSLQTPHTTEQVNKNQGRHTATAHKQRKEARSSSVATVSSALGDTAVQFSSEHSTPLP